LLVAIAVCLSCVFTCTEASTADHHKQPSIFQRCLFVQVALVCIGLCIRGLGPLLSSRQASAPMDEDARQRLYIGLASLLFASIAYSLLGVIYQTLVSTGDDPPSHSDIMLQSSIIG